MEACNRLRWRTALSVSLMAHVALLLVIARLPSATGPVVDMPLDVELAPRAVLPPKSVATPPSSAVKPKPEAIRQPSEHPAPLPEESPPRATTTAQEPAAPAPTTPTAYPLSRVQRLPRPLHDVEPTYPPIEQAAGVEKQVTAEITVDTNGHVIDISIIESGGANFDAAVKAAVWQSTYVPGFIDDKPVVTRFQRPFLFNFKKR